MASAPPPPTNPTYEPPPPYGTNAPEYGDPSKPMYPHPPTSGAAPMNPGYAPPPCVGGPAQAVPTVQTVVVQAPRFGPAPMPAMCPRCQQQVISVVSYENGLLTWLIFGLLCFFGCWLFCCLIPFCVDSCKDVRHFCPNCRAPLGYYKQL